MMKEVTVKLTREEAEELRDILRDGARQCPCLEHQSMRHIAVKIEDGLRS
jgi:hypothetical protein